MSVANTGRFSATSPRQFKKTCRDCGQQFVARTGSRSRCYDCCRCQWCNAQLTHADTGKRFCDNSCAGKWKYRNSERVKQALDDGRDHPNRGIGIARARTGVPRHDMRGEHNPNWRDGISRRERHTAMGRVEYVEWRRGVFARDDFTCQDCDQRGGRLNAHHIEPWAKCPELRYDLDNGVTLCLACHRTRHQDR